MDTINHELFGMELGSHPLPSHLAEAGVKGIYPQDLAGTLTSEIPVSLNRARIGGAVTIGMLTYVGPGCELNNVSLGRFCAVAPNVLIGATEHPTDWLSVHPFQYNGTRQFKDQPAYEEIAASIPFDGGKGPSYIGNDVWIGEGAVVRRGTRIGDGAIVAARAVVSRDVEPYTVVAGVPARPIRTRFSADLVARLLALRWWEYDLAPVSGSLDFSDAEACTRHLEELVATQRIGRKTPRSLKLNRAGNEFNVHPAP
ncbi:CatB-related O-acetyltransferase [Arthrobacter sulfonylureivorans]|uniref:CatB-related O-acetyltransferase n=1 Tax=Arthrobacter sulfonylureivorans TaxID=2486855 RepID=UPI0039E31F20